MSSTGHASPKMSVRAQGPPSATAMHRVVRPSRIPPNVLHSGGGIAAPVEDASSTVSLPQMPAQLSLGPMIFLRTMHPQNWCTPSVPRFGAAGGFCRKGSISNILQQHGQWLGSGCTRTSSPMVHCDSNAVTAKTGHEPALTKAMRPVSNGTTASDHEARPGRVHKATKQQSNTPPHTYRQVVWKLGGNQA